MDASKLLQFINYLRGHSDIQAKVIRRLGQHDDFDRDDAPGTLVKIKSGRYRLGETPGTLATPVLCSKQELQNASVRGHLSMGPGVPPLYY